ncbi:McrB family protein [Winogradskyella vidalii]|uniref:McrB family protein n=1 Tax=Winogradskyella vidalii TaxID=2615024 RepID=UPI0015CBF797|nr:AAA family ATPase [Winogradskyella vidalii]
MLFEKVTSENIKAAVDYLNENGIPEEFSTSKYYDVKIDNKLYPPKPIMAIANYYAIGKPIGNYFSGGENTPCFKAFKRLKFEIINKSNVMSDYSILNEFISKLKSGDIEAANSIKSLITGHNFKENLKVIDRIFFENKLREINSDNYEDTITFIRDIHKIKSGEYNDFNIWSASKTHLNKTNENLIQRHDELDKIVGFPDNGNGLYKSFLGEKNLLTFIRNKFNKNLKSIKISPNKTPEILFNLNSFSTNCKESGLNYNPQLTTRYIASLATKPFVLLSGLSGSGKTKLAQAFAQWIAEDKTQYCIVPVGADWTNREPLLGYVNALNDNEYILPENGALKLLIEANKEENKNKPYFLILDEMNLSHVERYFADFLSVMESKDILKLHSSENNKSNVPSQLDWPSNLFIIGTVNIDETTYMFSPKVLDRANVIEFRVNRDDIAEFLKAPNDIDFSNLSNKGAAMGEDFISIASNKDFPKSDTTELNKNLVLFFEELKKTGAEFGYRSATEIHRLFNQLTTLDNTIHEDTKIDITIMQKLLPKLHGSRRKLCPILEVLASLCVEEKTDVSKDFLNNKETLVFRENENVLYPLSLEKITRMYKGAIDNGFASYAEA